jgi:hypothetical protein
MKALVLSSNFTLAFRSYHADVAQVALQCGELFSPVSIVRLPI